MGPPIATLEVLQPGVAVRGKKAAELLRGSQIIFRLEQTTEKGKGVYVKEKGGGWKQRKTKLCGWLEAH